MRAARVLRDEGLDFSLHMAVTDWNVDEIPAMIDLAQQLGAKVLNFFFLVRTGRGRRLTDITAAQYEQILTYLARVQGVGGAAPGGPEDPWEHAGGPRRRPAHSRQVRAPLPPHPLAARPPPRPLLKNYAHGSCPAGKYYCRITPEGDVTPCPYMPVTAGNLRTTSFAELWQQAQVFTALRDPQLGGRCGVCEFRQICGGCRCRAYATYGDYLAEDPACAYQPGQYHGQLIELPPEQTFGLEVRYELQWDEAAQARLQAIPSFARGMVAKAVEAYARAAGQTRITPELLAEVRQKWGTRFRPRWFSRS